MSPAPPRALAASVEVSTLTGRTWHDRVTDAVRPARRLGPARDTVVSRLEPAGPVPGALVLLALCLSVLAPLMVLARAPSGVTFVVVLVWGCISPGTAVLALLAPRSGHRPLGLIVAASVACTILAAQTMLWLHAWNPRAWLYGLAGLCLVAIAISPADAWVGETLRWARQLRAPRPTTADVFGWAAPLLALVLWVVSLAQVEIDRIGGLGLMNALPAAYFVALAVLILSFVVAITRRTTSTALLTLHVVALVVVLHGTAAVLYQEPRYGWTYKHIGVIEMIAATGQVDRSNDIYNNWPAFFAANAWLSSVSRLSPLSYAAWSQVFFNLANAAVLCFALRGLTRNARLVWLAVWIFLLGNWIGQDYLAPQPVAFLLALAATGLVLRSAPLRSSSYWDSPRRLGRSRRWLEHGRANVPVERAPFALRPRAALLIGAILYLAVVVTHQLSPLMLLAGAVGLVVVGRLPVWVLLGMATVEAAWVLLAWPYIQYSLLDFGSSVPGAVYGWTADALPGVAVSGLAAKALMAVLSLIAVAGVVRRLRAGNWDAAAVVLAGAPVAVLAAQPYGGEGILRAWLFALPWLAFFAATALMPTLTSKGLPSRSGRIGLAVATATAVGLFLFAYFGREMVNRIDRDDVRASVWLEDHAPDRSTVFVLSQNVPGQLTARYHDVYGNPASIDDFIASQEFREHRLGPADIPAVLGHMQANDGGAPAYVMLSPSQERYGRLFGLVPDGTIASFTRALEGSSSFRLLYRSGQASVFVRVPAVASGSQP